MTEATTKRIMRDVFTVMNDTLDSHNICIYHDPSDIKKVKIMMIGDVGTPYEFGIFYFYLSFPDNYPYSPPNMKFVTSDGRTRFNPNLYINGKICLSLLNTWSGPRWTACNTLKSLLISIKSMILGIPFPLENEPGFQLTDAKRRELQAKGAMTLDSIYERYNAILEYNVIQHTIIRQFEQIPPGMDVFRMEVEKHLNLYAKAIRQKILTNSALFNKMYSTVSYCSQCQFLDYDTLLMQFDKTLGGFLEPLKTDSSSLSTPEQTDEKHVSRSLDEYSDCVMDQYQYQYQDQGQGQQIYIDNIKSSKDPDNLHALKNGTIIEKQAENNQTFVQLPSKRAGSGSGSGPGTEIVPVSVLCLDNVAAPCNKAMSQSATTIPNHVMHAQVQSLAKKQGSVLPPKETFTGVGSAKSLCRKSPITTEVVSSPAKKAKIDDCCLSENSTETDKSPDFDPPQLKEQVADPAYSSNVCTLLAKSVYPVLYLLPFGHTLAKVSNEPLKVEVPCDPSAQQVYHSTFSNIDLLPNTDTQSLENQATGHAMHHNPMCVTSWVSNEPLTETTEQENNHQNNHENNHDKVTPLPETTAHQSIMLSGAKNNSAIAPTSVAPKVKGKRCPSQPAKDYPVGTVMCSDNDGQQYIVKSYTKQMVLKSGAVEEVKVLRWFAAGSTGTGNQKS